MGLDNIESVDDNDWRPHAAVASFPPFHSRRESRLKASSQYYTTMYFRRCAVPRDVLGNKILFCQYVLAKDSVFSEMTKNKDA